MSRSLPLQEFVPTTPATADVRLSGTVAVFDPALCCPTGVCGPGVDPALLQIARDLRWLEAQGATVVRAGLSQEPQAFVANAKVSGLMQAFGDYSRVGMAVSFIYAIGVVIALLAPKDKTSVLKD